MSKVQEFLTKAHENEELRAALKSCSSREAALAMVVTKAGEMGYDLTAEEVESHMKAASERELSEEELATLSGGDWGSDWNY